MKESIKIAFKLEYENIIITLLKEYKKLEDAKVYISDFESAINNLLIKYIEITKKITSN